MSAARPRLVVGFLVGLLCLTAACDSQPSATTSPTVAGQPVAAEHLRTEVLATFPHDATAYTQGLLVAEDDSFFESTGLRGQSTVRRTRRDDGAVLQSTDLPGRQFGEGLARVGDRLIQLTWKDGVAHVYDAATLTPVSSFDYRGEGWGLCYDGQRLVMSDGSDTLTFRDPDTFAIEGSVAVTLDGASLRELNELECVEGSVYANVYQTDRIVQIDPASGAVMADIDASGLLDPTAAAGADVLNGIAHDPVDGAFYVTGKLWPWLFQVDFVPTG